MPRNMCMYFNLMMNIHCLKVYKSQLFISVRLVVGGMVHTMAATGIVRRKDFRGYIQVVSNFYTIFDKSLNTT